MSAKVEGMQDSVTPVVLGLSGVPYQFQFLFDPVGTHRRPCDRDGKSAFERARSRQRRPRASGRRGCGDIVAVRTGRMTVWSDPQTFLTNGPGINVRAAQWLVEGHGAMIVGADQ